MATIVETEKLIAEIISFNMGLKYLNPRLITPHSNNFVTIYNQDFTIPNNDGMFIVVQFVNGKTLSNNTKIENTDSGIIEVHSTIQTESLLINIFSRNVDSRQRKWQVITSLNSVFSEQQQERYGFRIFPIPQSTNNISRAEGSSMLNRYGIEMKIQRCYNELIKHNEYYDKFGVDVWDEPHLEEGKPLIHLEFTGES